MSQAGGGKGLERDGGRGRARGEKKRYMEGVVGASNEGEGVVKQTGWREEAEGSHCMICRSEKVWDRSIGGDV